MAMSQAAWKAEQAIGHGDNAVTEQDVTNPALNKERWADPSDKMKALAWMGKNTVEVVECPKPKVIEDRDVILKITGSTVCGSDLHLLHGSVVELQKGDILGHEFCGVVDEMGAGVKNLKKGDRVVASFQIACGECIYCQKKLSSQCARTNASSIENAMYGGRTAGMFGYSHFTGGFAGGQAEYTRVPFGDINLLKLPDDVPDEKGLYLSDVLSTSWNCVVDTGVKEGDVVAIWGAGPIGQMCADFSFINGASRVIMVDQNWRLDYVKQKYPKVETVDFSQLGGSKGVVSKLKEMVDGHGPDVALECVAGEYPKSWLHTVELATGMETDTSEILNEMIESVKNYGRVGITGVYVGYTNHFNIGSVMERGIRFIGNGQAPVHLYWEDLLKKIQKGEIDPLKMITHRVSVEDLAKVYEKFDKKEDGQAPDIGQFPSIDALRKWIIQSKAAMSAQIGGKVPGVKETDRQVPMRDGATIACRVYAPEQASSGSPLVVIYHGGGWCIGGLENEELLSRLLTSKLGCVCVNVDYRLAPEHKFPAPVHDSLDATKWAAENASSLGADPSKGFIIGGTSAGGNITAVISHIWRDEKLKPAITGAHLMIPAICHASHFPSEYAKDYKSWDQNKDAAVLSRQATDLFTNNYLRDKSDAGNPLFSPLLFPTGHKDLPASYFQVCGMDPLRDEALIYEKLLREESGVRTKLDVYSGFPHGFWSIAPRMKASERFVQDSIKGVQWLLQQA
ncbi:GroES-like protein [Hortaea werneckii]|nr:GroES-like protein [Hortaea werneckii]KAI6998524.1 GroES-like protein [Hortaea werneckii]KAI7149273.1 GroES-like protein [Hortaea werneckii]KAI7178964.1 GroES-like protein [Hortaea werneckii]KAI7191265.1 GroES-like protein [Hortaea werneckii]